MTEREIQIEMLQLMRKTEDGVSFISQCFILALIGVVVYFGYLLMAP